jgi:hypothetical protein
LLLPCIIILFLHLWSSNHKCTQSCYFPLLLRRRRWTGIFQWGVLSYVLPRLPFLWSYGVFCCSISLRVVIVFRDITYVIIILYSWHLAIYKHFWPYVWNNWSWVMHMMSTWFWHKNWVWHVSVWERYNFDISFDEGYGYMRPLCSRDWDVDHHKVNMATVFSPLLLVLVVQCWRS